MEIITDSLFFGAFISIIGYGIGTLLKKKLKSPIFNPLLIAILFVIFLLKITHISYPDYNMSAKYVSYLLTPATVCLAIPLYEQLALLREHRKAIVIGVFSGVLASMGSVLLFAVLFHLSQGLYVTLLPKSITTAIGMGVSEEFGGNVTITVAVIIITGILGNMIAETVCRIFHIHNPIAKGLAIGTASHAIGTTKAMEMGEVEGAMSSLAIVVAGLMTVLMASGFTHLYG